MKKYFQFFTLFVLATSFAFAQTEVPPGQPDALFNAVTNASAGDVLVLTNGAVYPITARLPVAVPLTIKTADDAGAKALIVFLANASGEYDNVMIEPTASLTIKNVYASGQAGTLSPTGWRFIAIQNIGNDIGSKVHVDNCEVTRFTQAINCGNVDTLIVENSLFNGLWKNAGQWGYTIGWGAQILKYIRIQNNSFISTIYGPLQGNGWGNFKEAEAQLPTLIIDHNTVYNNTGAHGTMTQFTRVENATVSNNLFINPSFRANEFFSDKYVDFPQNSDDITPYLGQISHLGPKGLWVLSTEMVDSSGQVLDMHANNIQWTSDILDMWSAKGLDPLHIYTNELAAALVNEADAYFQEQVTFVNAPDVPIANITLIADFCLAGNTATAAGDTSYIGTTPYVGYDWYDGVDPLFDLRESSNLDMSYNTDAISYTAGDGGFPLGDLNWYPELKEIWAGGGTVDVEKTEGVPTNYSLAQNYPNPFNPSTKISFSIPESGLVSLKVYNMIGQVVAELINEEMSPGNYNFDFNASDLSSGVYVYQISAGTFTSSMKMMLLK